MKPHPEIQPVFVATWVVFVIVFIWFISPNGNVQRKKRLLPAYIIGIGAAFIFFAFLMTGGDLHILKVVVPGVALISALNLWVMEICSRCGRLTQFTVGGYCSKCRARLEP